MFKATLCLSAILVAVGLAAAESRILGLLKRRKMLRTVAKFLKRPSERTMCDIFNSCEAAGFLVSASALCAGCPYYTPAMSSGKASCIGCFRGRGSNVAEFFLFVAELEEARKARREGCQTF